VLSLLEVPSIETFPAHLPCTSYPSDHLALAARMTI